MAALSAVAPVLNKAPVVSTGKAANTNSMMVWQPHGNKCVSPLGPARAFPSNGTMLVLKFRLFLRSRLAPRRATPGSPRPMEFQSIVVARSHVREDARSPRAVSGTDARCFSLCPPSFSRRAYPIPRSSARRFERARTRAARHRAFRGRNEPGRSPALHTAAESSRRRLDGSRARGVPRASSRFCVSERRFAKARAWLFPVRDRAVSANANRVSIDPRTRR